MLATDERFTAFDGWKQMHVIMVQKYKKSFSIHLNKICKYRESLEIVNKSIDQLTGLA